MYNSWLLEHVYMMHVSTMNVSMMHVYIMHACRYDAAGCRNDACIYDACPPAAAVDAPPFENMSESRYGPQTNDRTRQF